MDYSEVLEKRAKGQCLVIINQGVYDLTRIKPFHPVGEFPIDIFSGKDATWFFNLVPFHRKEAKTILAGLNVSDLITSSENAKKIPTLKLHFSIVAVGILSVIFYVFTM